MTGITATFKQHLAELVRIYTDQGRAAAQAHYVEITAGLRAFEARALRDAFQLAIKRTP